MFDTQCQTSRACSRHTSSTAQQGKQAAASELCGQHNCQVQSGLGLTHSADANNACAPASHACRVQLQGALSHFRRELSGPSSFAYSVSSASSLQSVMRHQPDAVQRSAQSTPPEHVTVGLSQKSLLSIEKCRREPSSEQACTYTLSSCHGVGVLAGLLHCAAQSPPVGC